LRGVFFQNSTEGMPRVITSRELEQKNTVALARWLLGKVLVRQGIAGREIHQITEVEAYHGESDLACHARKGRTKRTEVMYQSGGRWYVYLCYGVHEMLNLVTGPAGQPSAVLIRGLEKVSGPGRLTKRLGLTRALNNQPASPESGLYLENHGVVVSPRHIKSGPRIGVAYAGPVWSAKPWRFWVERKAL
jgi:DNA-3-methyladenine glycosylase